MQIHSLIATIQAAGLPALRIVSIIAVLISVGLGAHIYRLRHQLFDRDPELAEYADGDGPRHVRLELVLTIWGVLMLVMLAICYQIWRA